MFKNRDGNIALLVCCSLTSLAIAFFILPGTYRYIFPVNHPKVFYPLFAVASLLSGILIFYLFRVNAVRNLAKGRHWMSLKFAAFLLYALWLLFPFTFILLFIEDQLRKESFFPGIIVPQLSFTRTDSVYLTNEFYGDASGIMIANNELWNERWKNETGLYVNPDGFRSEEFHSRSQSDSLKRSVLFLGDSHTWGMTAQPLTDCFVDRVKAAGYSTFNTGIVGADPAQYLAIAEKYLPVLKPDFCFVMFDIANDIMWYKRELVPFHPLFYFTNVGALDAYKPDWADGCPNERFATFRESYNYFIKTFTILSDDLPWFTKLCAQSSVGTRIIRSFYPVNYNACFSKPDKPVSDFYLEKIDSLCRGNGIRFQVFVIPDKSNIQTETSEIRKTNPGLFTRLDIKVPPGISLEDYRPGTDGHFNNEGHKKCAEYLLTFLKDEKFR